MERKRNLVLILSMLICFQTSYTQVNQKDSKGRKQGVWQKNYPKSNAFEYKGQFKDDKPVGTFYYYYPSTKVKAIVKHDANSTRSACVMYQESGVILAQGIYRNQLKDSVWMNYGPSGRLSYKETFKNGKLNGMKTIYYVPEEITDKRTLVARTEMYVNDVLNGEVIEYFESGVIKSKSKYENGKIVGIMVINHPNGKPMVQERYKYGNRHGWCIGYDVNGVETGRKYFKFGRELTGEELENWINECKSKGRSPND